MGNQCCAGVSNNSVGVPVRIPVESLPQEVRQTIPLASQRCQDLDPIYLNCSTPLQEMSSRLNIPQDRINSKRSSQPSLIRLNNEITDLINTFEKLHGTIGNEATRSNFQENRRKIKQLTNDAGEINLKKKGFAQGIITGNDQISQNKSLIAKEVNEPPQQNQNSVKDSFNRRITEQQNDSVGDSYSSSSHRRQSYKEGQGGFNEYSKNVLDIELIDEDMYKKKEEIITKTSTIGGNYLKIWDRCQTEAIMLDFKGLRYNVSESVYCAAVGSIIFYYEMFNITLVAYTKIDPSTNAVKIWVNGSKRELQVEAAPTDNSSEVFMKALRKLYDGCEIQTSPCYEVYHLSGWCPECLLMEEITNKDNLWDRLTENYLQGNIIISFGQFMENGTERYLTLKQLDKVSGVMTLYSPQGPPLPTIMKSQSNLYVIVWASVSQIFDRIYINWNPSIYIYNKKLINTWKTCKSLSQPFKIEQICLSNNPQYLIKIPKHQEDFQIRIFVDRHIQSFRKGQRILLKLFEYDGVRALDPTSCIRTLQATDRELLSDVFIFQKSDETDYFILTVQQGQPQAPETQIYYSILFLSFIEIDVLQLPIQQVLLTKSINSIIKPQNQGQLTNCPNFTSNLHYYMNVPPESHLRVTVEGHPQLQFSILLFEDTKQCEDILQIEYEMLLDDNDPPPQTFCQFGFVQKQVKSQNYFLVVACIQAPSNPQLLKVTVSIMSQLKNRNVELEECYPPIKLKELHCAPNIIKTFPVKWTKDHSGQRKRFKNTTTPIYHPISTFSEFLKNPSFTLKLNKGRYQFNIVSQDYKKEYFTYKVTTKEEGISQPPALSVAVLKLSDNQKGYKIILDDAVYVPIGYGYWTENLELEEGKYTIICPRINKEVGRGTLSIRQL